LYEAEFNENYIKIKILLEFISAINSMQQDLFSTKIEFKLGGLTEYIDCSKKLESAL